MYFSFYSRRHYLPNGDEFSSTPKETVHSDWTDAFLQFVHWCLIIPGFNVENDIWLCNNFTLLLLLGWFTGIVGGDALGLNQNLIIKTAFQIWTWTGKTPKHRKIHSWGSERPRELTINFYLDSLGLSVFLLIIRSEEINIVVVFFSSWGGGRCGTTLQLTFDFR